ncbi:MAG: right-handed parallel beta-helix repeat-containing protein [Planctomycetota bacterium]|nr:right-handed parallel beta-helix repeat-containing protein [Planctomycetota bacterium]
MHARMIVLAAAGLVVATSASAATRFVNAAAAPGGDGSSWATAYNSLQTALASAGAGDELWVARGVYTPTSDANRNISFIIPAGVTVRGGFAGDEDSPKDRPADPDPRTADPLVDTVLSGEIGAQGAADNSRVVVRTDPYTSTRITLDRLSIVAGYDIAGSGAGMINEGNIVTLEDCLIAGNEAFSGGGMLNWYSSDVTLSRCVLRANRASGQNGSGGAVYLSLSSILTVSDSRFEDNYARTLGGAVTAFSSVASYARCTFERNDADLTRGGALYTYDCGLTISDSFFADNTASGNGGALLNQRSVATITDTTFLRNMGDVGGATCDEEFGPVNYIRCTYDSNRSNLSGGGAATFAGNSHFTDCTFTANDASAGGGIYIAGSTSSTITRCTFQNNLAQRTSTRGGGLYIVASARCTVTDSTFTGNRTSVGGGVDAGGSGHDFIRCAFVQNACVGSGGAANLTAGTSNFINCLMARNAVGVLGSAVLAGTNATSNFYNCTVVENNGGIESLYHGGPMTVVNSIVRNPTQFQLRGPSTATVTWSNVLAGITGAGNFNADPGFVDPAANDFRLAPASVCIDRGSNAGVPAMTTLDLARAPRFRDDPSVPDAGNGVAPVVDVGAYEFQPPAPCPGDANNDGVVNFPDITAVLQNWTGPGPAGDANNDGVVSFPDITSILQNWTRVCS